MSRDTCVVLVCINNKQNKLLGHDKFYKAFSPCGTIQRILIFEKTVLWKLFVEFDCLESARLALELNGTDLEGDQNLKMGVYESQLQQISFSENNSGGVDYTLLRQKDQSKTNSTTASPMYRYGLSSNNSTASEANREVQLQTPSSRFRKPASQQQLQSPTMNWRNSSRKESIKVAETDNNQQLIFYQQLQLQIASINSQLLSMQTMVANDFKLQSIQVMKQHTAQINQLLEELEAYIKPQMGSISELQEIRFMGTFVEERAITSQIPSMSQFDEGIDPSEYTNPQFTQAPKRTKVIYARYFDSPQVNIQHLYHMFSMYGDIERMIYMKEKGNVLVQYLELQHAKETKEKLQGVIVNSKAIKIFYSNYEQVTIKGENGSTFTETPLEDYFKGSEATKKVKQQQSPSKLLVLDEVEETQSKDILAKFNPMDSRIVESRLHIYFDSIEQAIIAILHYPELNLRFA